MLRGLVGRLHYALFSFSSLAISQCCVKVRCNSSTLVAPSSSLGFTLQKRRPSGPSAYRRTALPRNARYVFILRVPESNLSRLLCTDECRAFIRPLASWDAGMLDSSGRWGGRGLVGANYCKIWRGWALGGYRCVTCKSSFVVYSGIRLCTLNVICDKCNIKAFWTIEWRVLSSCH